MHRPSKLGLGSNNLSVSAHKNGIDNSFFFFCNTFIDSWDYKDLNMGYLH